MAKRVGFSEETPLSFSFDYGQYDDDDDDAASAEAFENLKMDATLSERDREFAAAERLSMRLLSVPDDDEEQQDRILRESLHLVALTERQYEAKKRQSIRMEKEAKGKFCTMASFSVLALFLVALCFYVGAKVIGPPSQPIGPYQLVELQVSLSAFWLRFGCP
jgi:hypothetical protein